MFVNELSLVAASDVATAQATAQQYVLTIMAAVRRGLPRNLRIPEDFYARQLAPAYFWRNFLADKRVDVDVRRYFRSLTTRSPFLRDLPEMDTAFAGMDCYCSSQTALGLKAAYVADGLALSMATQEAWDRASIVCEIHEIVDEEISCRAETVHHASSTQHVELHSDWIRTRMQMVVASGKQLWQRRGEFFPKLDWCAAVEDQMARLPVASLSSIVRGLFRLNAYCLLRREGGFDSASIECAVSEESPSTLSKYGKEREFLCPNGKRLVFSWHAKVGRWRIHFDPDVGPGKLLIGYVGKHLRTTKFN
jgi:hypothetical protein